MSILDHLPFTPDELSSEFNLYRPNYDYSVSAVLPEILRQSPFIQNMNLDDLSESTPLRSKIDDSFPSGYSNIVLLICDGLGAHHLQQISPVIWDNITTDGLIGTTVFPSMTSTAMSSISYGLNPAQHGIMGYNFYNEHIDGLWNALNLQYLNNGEEEMILDRHQLEDFISGVPIVDRIQLSDDNVNLSFFVPEGLEEPGLLNLINPNLDQIKYSQPKQLIEMLFKQLNEENDHQFITAYIPWADYQGHQFGPESVQYKQAVKGIEQVLGKLMEHPDVESGETLILLTSDHGQVQIDKSNKTTLPRKNWNDYMNNGILLGNSGRVIHGYAPEDKITKLHNILENLGKDRGHIVDINDSLSLFGGNTKFENRIGQKLLILEDEYLVDIPEIVKYDTMQDLSGQHGSLTEKELYVPIAIVGGQN